MDLSAGWPHTKDASATAVIKIEFVRLISIVPHTLLMKFSKLGAGICLCNRHATRSSHARRRDREPLASKSWPALPGGLVKTSIHPRHLSPFRISTRLQDRRKGFCHTPRRLLHARRCAGHARFAGPEDPSGPGCWTTFLTCPN
jgi:hypothetical protein